MSPTAKALGIDRLSVPERILLVEEIWDSISEEVNAAELTQEEKDLLDRRLASLESDPQAGSSWEEVKARLLSRP